MPYYRELAGNRVFVCAKCGKRKRVKYVPKSNLCRDCAAKDRRKPDNGSVQLESNLVVTKMVERRFIKEAEKEIPLSKAEITGENISRWGTILFWVTSYFVARTLVKEFSELFWIVFWGWALGGTLGCVYLPDLVLAKRKAEHRAKIRVRILDLAESRRQKIDEAKQFYSSPEWSLLRGEVIKVKGRVCIECGCRIKHDNDITVDHIKPRSKYPELAL